MCEYAGGALFAELAGGGAVEAGLTEVIGALLEYAGGVEYAGGAEYAGGVEPAGATEPAPY